MTVDKERVIKDAILTDLRATSKEQHALNRIIRNRTRNEELEGNEFWILQNLIDEYLWSSRNEDV